MSNSWARPKIISPAPRQIYVLAGADTASQKVLFEAASGGDKVYWFVDDTLYRTCAPQEQTFWPLEPGTHKIVCCDEAGRNTTVVITVK